jgi:tRNA-Thr(GGU) m(6)t(6)A37 methyltransferase TsaA
MGGVLLSVDNIEVFQIGVVNRDSPEEDEFDRSLVSRIVLRNEFADGLKGIERFSHVFIIYWLDRIPDSKKRLVVPVGSQELSQQVGVFATRMPIRPNPIGLSLVELIKHESNTIWVRGLDALDGTPVLDIKPYPECVKGQFIIADKFKVPNWLRRA